MEDFNGSSLRLESDELGRLVVTVIEREYDETKAKASFVLSPKLKGELIRQLITRR